MKKLEGRPTDPAPAPAERPRVQDYHVFHIVNKKNKVVSHAHVYRKFGQLYVTDVWTEGEERGKGFATSVLQAVLAMYGHEDLYLLVSPYTDQPLDELDLVRFYQRFGFEMVGPVGLMKRPAGRDSGSVADQHGTTT